MMRTVPVSLALFVFGSAYGPWAAVQATEPPEQKGHGIVSVLRDLRLRPNQSTQSVAQALAPYVTKKPEEALSILAQKRVPALAEEDAEQALSTPQRRALLEALRQSDPQQLREAAQNWFSASPTPDRRNVLVRTAGLYLPIEELQWVFDQSQPTGVSQLEDQSERELCEALVEILQREERAFQELHGLWQRQPALLLPVLLTAVGEARDPQALAMLADVLLWSPELVRQTLATIRLVGPSTDHALNVLVAGALLPFAGHEDPQIVRATYQALSSLQYTAIVPDLVEALTAEHRGVRDSAHFALRELTGLRLPADSAVWTRWYEGEVLWLHKHRARLESDFGLLDTPDLAKLVRECIGHPLFRHETAGVFGAWLANVDSAERAILLAGIADLGSRAPLEQVEGCLDDVSLTVRQAAAEAVARLTEPEADGLKVSAR